MRKRISCVLVLILLMFTLSVSGLFAQGQQEEEKPVIAFSIMDFSIDFLGVCRTYHHSGKILIFSNEKPVYLLIFCVSIA